MVACGPTGDTEGLKQDVEKNKLSIESLIIKPKYTRTLSPLTTAPDNPKYYLDHNDSEQLLAYGVTATNEEFLLADANWSITDSTSTAGQTTIDNNGLLTTEAFAATNQSKLISINIDFSSLSASADIVISSSPLATNGLSIKMADTVVNSTTQAVVVCDTKTFTVTGLFDDGSTRDVTSKIDWSAALVSNDAKFLTTDPNTAVFSSHTNADYVVTPNYKSQGSGTVTLSVSNTNFSNLIINSSTLSLAVDETDSLSVTADIGSGNVNTTVSSQAKWVSTDTTIVTVDTSGVITGVKIGGPTNVTAQCGSSTATSAVTVNTGKTITHVRILDEDDQDVTQNLLVNEAVNLKLMAYWSDSSESDVTTDSNTVWNFTTIPDSGNPITVNNDTDKGLVTAIGTGSAMVNATYKDEKDDLLVSVTTN